MPSTSGIEFGHPGRSLWTVTDYGCPLVTRLSCCFSLGWNRVCLKFMSWFLFSQLGVKNIYVDNTIHILLIILKILIVLCEMQMYIFSITALLQNTFPKKKPTVLKLNSYQWNNPI